MSYVERMSADMFGRALKAVDLNLERDVVTFRFADGGVKEFTTEGDCCSHSWIEHLEAPPDLDGATLLTVAESSPVDETCRREHDECKNADCLKVYSTTFRTNRGDIVLEYRNSSNGYYGGYLTEVAP